MPRIGYAEKSAGECYNHGSQVEQFSEGLGTEFLMIPQTV